MAKTDLEKSHSKISNAKLTFICLFLSLGVGAIFFGLALINIKLTIAIITMICGALVALINLYLLNRFTR